MDTLPFLVVHGEWVWRLSLLGVVMFALGYTWLRRRFRVKARMEKGSSESSGERDDGDIEVGETASEVERGPIRDCLVPMSVGLGVFGVFFLIAPLALDEASERVLPPDEGGSLEDILRVHRSTTLLAATPFGRDKALKRLEYVVQLRGWPGPKVREALIGLGDLVGGCEEAMAWMLKHRQFERTLERRRDCDTPRAHRLAARAALALGRIEEASDLLDGEHDGGSIFERRDSIRVHLLAGELSRAAREARRTAHWLVGDGDWMKSDAEAVESRAESSARFRCLAHVLHAREGDAAARAELDFLLDGDASIKCHLLAADLASGDDRESLLSGVARMLEAAADADESRRAGHRRRFMESIMNLLRAESDPEAKASLIYSALPGGPHSNLGNRLPTGQLPTGQLVGHEETFAARTLGLERGLLEALRGRDELSSEALTARTILAYRSAVDASIVLRHDEALRLLRIAREGAESFDMSSIFALEAFEALIELRRGDLEATRQLLGGELEAKRRLLGIEPFYLSSLQEMSSALEAGRLPKEYYTMTISREALDEALQGDDARLFAELRTPLNHIHRSTLHKLAPLAHQLPSEPLVHHLRYGRFGDPFEISTWTSAPNSLISLAIIASAVGDEELASDLTGAVHSLHDAASRREIAIPLILLNEL